MDDVLPICECAQEKVGAMVRMHKADESRTVCVECAVREVRAAGARGELLTIESHPRSIPEPDTQPEWSKPIDG